MLLSTINQVVFNACPKHFPCGQQGTSSIAEKTGSCGSNIVPSRLWVTTCWTHGCQIHPGRPWVGLPTGKPDSIFHPIAHVFWCLRLRRRGFWGQILLIQRKPLNWLPCDCPRTPLQAHHQMMKCTKMVIAIQEISVIHNMKLALPLCHYVPALSIAAPLFFFESLGFHCRAALHEMHRPGQ